MEFGPGVLSEPYALRAAPARKGERHSLRLTDSSRRKLASQFLRARKTLGIDPDLLERPFPKPRMNAGGRLDPRLMAWEMAAMAIALEQVGEGPVTVAHAMSAYALLCRQVDVVPGRPDRVIICGLAAAALARSGLRVHLVADGEIGIRHPEKVLGPAFERLALSFATVTAAADSAARREAYAASITLVTARECAMDFLRDAVAAPDRSNPELLRASRIGHKGSGDPVMCGLPCAVLIDADSNLIDMARAPIILNSDGGRLVSGQDVDIALNMIETLQPDEHFLWTGQGAEIQFTREGFAEFEAWCQALTGIWQVPNIAQLVLGAGLVSRYLIRSDAHYRIVDGRVRWQVQERLVPGSSVYPIALLATFVSRFEECEDDQTQAVAARSSYQQLFNHYLHLCGTAFSVAGNRGELRKIYGLTTRTSWPRIPRRCFQRAALAGDQENLETWLLAWARQHDADSCSLVVVGDADRAGRIGEVAGSVVPGLIDASRFDVGAIAGAMKPSQFVILTAAQLDHHGWYLGDLDLPQLRCLTLHRSPRLAEDRRQLHWRQLMLSVKQKQRPGDWLVLGADDKLFEGYRVSRLQRMLRLSGARLAARRLEPVVIGIQLRLAREFAVNRKALMDHDAAMQGMLAFSGRGIYGD